MGVTDVSQLQEARRQLVEHLLNTLALPLGPLEGVFGGADLGGLTAGAKPLQRAPVHGYLLIERSELSTQLVAEIHRLSAVGLDCERRRATEYGVCHHLSRLTQRERLRTSRVVGPPFIGLDHSHYMADG